MGPIITESLIVCSNDESHAQLLRAAYDAPVAVAALQPKVSSGQEIDHSYYEALLTRRCTVLNLIVQIYARSDSGQSPPGYCTVFHHMVKSAGSTVKSTLRRACVMDDAPLPGERECTTYVTGKALLEIVVDTPFRVLIEHREVHPQSE